jgi:hypothetical protein
VDIQCLADEHHRYRFRADRAEFFSTPSMSGIDFVNKLDDAYQARLKK